MEKEIHESEEKFQEINCPECKIFKNCIIYPCNNGINYGSCLTCFLSKTATNLNALKCFKCFKKFKNPELIKEWIKNCLNKSLNNQKLEKCLDCKNDLTFSFINCCQNSKDRCALCISKAYKFTKECPFCGAALDTKGRKEIENWCKIEGYKNPNAINLKTIPIQKESKCSLCNENQCCRKVNCCVDSDNLICLSCFKRKFLLQQNNLKCPFCSCKINYEEKDFEIWYSFNLLHGNESKKSDEKQKIPEEKKSIINERCAFESNTCKKDQLYCIHQCKSKSTIFLCFNCLKNPNKVNSKEMKNCQKCGEKLTEVINNIEANNNTIKQEVIIENKELCTDQNKHEEIKYPIMETCQCSKCGEKKVNCLSYDCCEKGRKNYTCLKCLMKYQKKIPKQMICPYCNYNYDNNSTVQYFYQQNYIETNIKTSNLESKAIETEKRKIQCKYCLVISEEIFGNVECCDWMINEFGRCMKCYVKKGYNRIQCESSKCMKKFPANLQDELNHFYEDLNFDLNIFNSSEPKENIVAKKENKNYTKNLEETFQKEYQNQDNVKEKDPENPYEEIKKNTKIAPEIPPNNLKCIICQKTELPNHFLIKDIGCIDKHSFHIDCLVEKNPEMIQTVKQFPDYVIKCPVCKNKANYKTIKEAINKIL